MNCVECEKVDEESEYPEELILCELKSLLVVDQSQKLLKLSSKISLILICAGHLQLLKKKTEGKSKPWGNVSKGFCSG